MHGRHPVRGCCGWAGPCPPAPQGSVFSAGLCYWTEDFQATAECSVIQVPKGLEKHHDLKLCSSALFNAHGYKDKRPAWKGCMLVWSAE